MARGIHNLCNPITGPGLRASGVKKKPTSCKACCCPRTVQWTWNDSITGSLWKSLFIGTRTVRFNEDRTEMQIAFHWLPLKENIPGAAKHIRSELVSIAENPYQDPKYRPRESPGRNNVVFHTKTGVRISSGYVFTVKTDNKRERPLPSMELLGIRWHLSRIARMQGKAEDEDSDYESDGGSVSVRSGSRSHVDGEEYGETDSAFSGSSRV
ncbi:hypothetical protein N7449_007733 [Penicillium cf. viridicatum]|uniref:HNH nuclease domain-containing protein n=1 Tax=Penicillium cf. viridicatum TaxID=2972119 RepID=A0A9W9JJ31_9EURO|nr:hypothetical protein N7449_007733 [Penicillium cf. viridicatum]